MGDGVAKSMELPQEIENRFNVQSSHSTYGDMSYKLKTKTVKHVHTHVQSSIIHTAKMWQASLNR